jgi:hypothetical protein
VPGGALFVACLLAGPARAALRRWKPGLGTPTKTTGAGPDDDRIGWHLISLGFSLGWFTCSMLSPLPYPLANLLVWLFAGIVLAPWLADGYPSPASPALTADGELSVRASAAA